ncbi:hypothetical protein KR074_008007 [Drosophila pseudoananassae]|nr:hypothetical protein KR074_008007 [Drosophila pseudoananassae]
MFGATCTQKIKLWMQSMDGYRLPCKVDRFQPLATMLKDTYRKSRGRWSGRMKLTFDGRQIMEWDTCNSLGMVDDDLVHVYITRYGDGPK